MPETAAHASIAILVFDGVEELDFVGPWEVFSMAKQLGAPLDVFTVGWPDTAITCAKGLKITADHAFADKPRADVVLVPGGKGTRQLAQDDVFNAELRSYLAQAKWQTSVCTGSALLARAGFLEGRQATTNRSALDFLRAHAPHTYILDQRFVHDGNIVTSAGVSAGIDMTLWLVGHLFGEDMARSTQTHMEYFPEPPYGNPA
ncbi:MULTISPECIES: DJ-1/PfpI family protein [Devosia]|uniref:DJ-1/PfpI family protein n=1 Tax=Devosia TaxID=46913 RepID=UPI002735F382|nr:DJ-1/PfpI family protein [Devosia sp.]MDP2780567.1 DJ-1/PfpI family protein [Devosia sp.]HLV82955.1 DJ-1/PfpI family protein [Devosia sp.]